MRLAQSGFYHIEIFLVFFLNKMHVKFACLYLLGEVTIRANVKIMAEEATAVPMNTELKSKYISAVTETKRPNHITTVSAFLQDLGSIFKIYSLFLRLFIA